MRFGTFSLDDATGAVLAHSMRGEGYVLKKGTVLDAENLARLRDAGIREVVAAKRDEDDVPEDVAADRIAKAACGPGLTVDRAFTGRCNLRAAEAGLLAVDTAAVNAANRVDEALTLATPLPMARLAARQLAATAKVIPYAAPGAALDRMCAALGGGALTLHPFHPLKVALIVTRAENQKESIVDKGAKAVRDRVVSLGSEAPSETVVPHEEQAVVNELKATEPCDLVLILGGSATSDRRDVAPAAVVTAGGRIERFGMPVDPGNLLVLGSYRGSPLVILPGCARSPALNGADWVLERLAARLPVTGEDIAAMGVGGLLKEIPSRPQPREAK